MKSNWQHITDSLYIWSQGGVETRATSINLNTGRYIVLDLTQKPVLKLATSQEFPTLEAAQKFIENEIN